MSSTQLKYHDAGVLAVEALALEQEGVVHKQHVHALGVTRFGIAREVRKGRWRLIGKNTIAIHRGPLPEGALWRRAIWEIGPDAALDGSSSLRKLGLTGYADDIHVSVPHGSRPDRVGGVQVHEVCNWQPTDVIDGEIPAIKPALAVVRAAIWARTARQASLVVIMPVQQRIVRAEDIRAAMQRWRRMPRRKLIAAVVTDAEGGVHSLGELDFARECRRLGLPEPSRQVVRQGKNGRWYLDVFFDDYGVVVEIEGIHHTEPLNAVDDSLRQNDISIGSRGVLRITLLGWRLHKVAYMEQVRRMLSVNGWRRAQDPVSAEALRS